MRRERDPTETGFTERKAAPLAVCRRETFTDSKNVLPKPPSSQY